MIEIYAFHIVVLMKVFKSIARLYIQFSGLFTRLKLTLENSKYVAEIHALCVNNTTRLNTLSVRLFTELYEKISNELYSTMIEIYAFHIAILMKMLFKTKARLYTLFSGLSTRPLLSKNVKYEVLYVENYTRLNTSLRGLLPWCISRLLPCTGRKYREPVIRLTPHPSALTRPRFAPAKWSTIQLSGLFRSTVTYCRGLNLAPWLPLSMLRKHITQYCRYNGYF